MVTEAAMGSGGRRDGSGAGWASGRSGRSPGVAWRAVETPGGGGGASISAAVAGHERERQKMNRCGRGGRRLKFFISDGHLGDRRT
jgi:hypothetical protein